MAHADGLKAYAQVLGEDAGVVARMLARDRGRQGHAHDVLGAEGIHGQHGHESGVDAARQGDQGALEAGLVGVVAQAQHQGLAHVRHVLLGEARRGGRMGLGRIEIHHTQVLTEGGHAQQQAAAGVAHHGAAVEDQLVVAADGVAVDDRALHALRGVLDQLGAHRTLALVPGTRGKVQDQVAAGGREGLDRVGATVEQARADRGMIPDVLADRQADATSFKFHDSGLGGGLKIAVLVKDVVRGKQGLARHGQDLSLLAEGRRVQERAAKAGLIGDHGAKDGGNLANEGEDLAQGFLHVADKALLQEQVTGRISAEHQLGKNDQLGAASHEGLVGLDDLAAVASQVSDDGVDLGESDAHGVWPLN